MSLIQWEPGVRLTSTQEMEPRVCNDCAHFLAAYPVSVTTEETEHRRHSPTVHASSPNGPRINKAQPASSPIGPRINKAQPASSPIGPRINKAQPASSPINKGQQSRVFNYPEWLRIPINWNTSNLYIKYDKIKTKDKIDELVHI